MSEITTLKAAQKAARQIPKLLTPDQFVLYCRDEFIKGAMYSRLSTINDIYKNAVLYQEKSVYSIAKDYRVTSDLRKLFNIYLIESIRYTYTTWWYEHILPNILETNDEDNILTDEVIDFYRKILSTYKDNNTILESMISIAYVKFMEKFGSLTPLYRQLDKFMCINWGVYDMNFEPNLGESNA